MCGLFCRWLLVVGCWLLFVFVRVYMSLFPCLLDGCLLLVFLSCVVCCLLFVECCLLIRCY